MKKRRIYEIMEKARAGDIYSFIYDMSMAFIIIINILSIVLLSCDLSNENRIIISLIERYTIYIFLIEYIVKIFTSEYKYVYSNIHVSKIKYIFSIEGIIDLLSISSIFIAFTPFNLSFLRILRIFKFVKIFELSKYGYSLKMISNVIKKEKEILFSSMFISLITIFISSVLMFNVEHSTQPEAFKDIPTSIWWAFVHLTTVGYGDIYPMTTAGRIIASILSIFGIGIVAIPSGIISAGFIKEMSDSKEARNILKNL